MGILVILCVVRLKLADLSFDDVVQFFILEFNIAKSHPMVGASFFARMIPVCIEKISFLFDLCLGSIPIKRGRGLPSLIPDKRHGSLRLTLNSFQSFKCFFDVFWYFLMDDVPDLHDYCRVLR